jgi:hypothetical protein
VISRIILDLHATGEYGHFHTCREVCWSKNDGLETRTRFTNFFDIDEPTCGFNLRFDADVLTWFRLQGPRYQSRMNAVLRAYMEAKVAPATKRVVARRAR